MHVNVSDLLAESTGYSKQFTITDEWPVLEELNLVAPVQGKLSVTRLDQGIMAHGSGTTEVERVCDRCLCSFTQALTFPLNQLFTEHPTGDELPLNKGVIDLAPLVNQEVLLALPIKSLCRPDCAGLQLLQQTKGTPRGRTEKA